MKTHSQSRTRLYRCWEAMKRRCTAPTCDAFSRYGGRGIAVCEEWMNEMGADEGLPELPPIGHPLRKLGARLGELLDEDQWAECERLLLEGWAHDEIDRKTGRHWRENSA